MTNNTHTAVLGEEQLSQYKRDGYTLVRGLISPGELAPIRQILAEIAAGQHDDTWPKNRLQVADPARFRNARGGMLAWGVQSPAVHNETFARICNHPRLVRAMEQILGGQVERHTDQALVKHTQFASGDGGQTFYHQDSYYWHIDPRLGCNAWIALDDVGPDAIALAILPGSQRDWKLEPHEQYLDDPPLHNAHRAQPIQRFRIPRERIDFSSETLLPMSVGDAAFFSNYTWHRADPNHCGVMKCAYAVAYQIKGTQPNRR